MEHITKILELSAKRIDYFVSVENVKDWYKGSKTYFEGIITETTEAEWENREQNHIFLEDELWDIFWNFSCLLSSLEHEWKISSREAVFRRCYDKFSERIGENADAGHNWNEIKNLQKARRQAEHEQFYNH